MSTPAPVRMAPRALSTERRRSTTQRVSADLRTLRFTHGEFTEANGDNLTAPAVHLRSAVCLLGRYPALAGVDLDVAEGEVVLVAGPNGAGKTTLLRLLAGLLPLSGGTAVVLGHDLAVDRHSVRAELALVGHAPGAYDDLTVRENVRFWVRAGGGRAADADAVLEQLGLARLAGVAFGRLSAGQQRRTGLAVALARRPRLLLLDEPHAGLDASGRDLLDDLLKSTAGGGSTVLLVSHELDRARVLADREVTIVAGAIRPVASGGNEGVPHGTHPDQLPPPQRVGVPRPDRGGAR
jgi:heme ABC exporter ATP-binding subunit CcmA